MDTRLRVSDVGDVDVRNVQNKVLLPIHNSFSYHVEMKALTDYKSVVETFISTKERCMTLYILLIKNLLAEYTLFIILKEKTAIEKMDHSS